MGDNYRLFFLAESHASFIFSDMRFSLMLPIHQEENKERFKFQEAHSWAEVFYDIQTRGLDLVYAQC